jgi:hypothetical protein
MGAVALFIPIFGILSGTAIILTAMTLLGRHFSERRPQITDEALNEVLRRLERIEQIVDTTGIEVERLSEANRFMSKLLTERSGVPTNK